ncbi:gluconokinase [Yoonia sp.]|uniref:gluconokinase n=1 Tax=Yoonia sp. TaxID=2212373 RepID=UPI003F6B835B
MKPAIMVMGVSGAGKSTVGAALATALGAVFLDGDDYHPQANVDHMAAGHPLTDAMRWPWLDRLGAAVQAARADHAVVFACSALKRSYREYLRAAIPGLRVAYLDAPQLLVADRLAQRRGHFMPANLLNSQFATLDAPRDCISVSIDQPITAIVQDLCGRL